METQTYKTRTRINFSSTSKGIISAEITYEGIDQDKYQVLKEAKEIFLIAKQTAKEMSDIVQ